MHDQLELFSRQVDQLSRNAIDSRAASEIETVLALGLHLYGRLREADEQWSVAAQRSGKPGLTTAKHLQSLYAKWAQPSAQLLPMVQRAEASGYAIQDSKHFYEAYGQVASVAKIDLERLYGPVIGNLRRHEEVRDEFRRRVG